MCLESFLFDFYIPYGFDEKKLFAFKLRFVFALLARCLGALDGKFASYSNRCFR